MFFGVGKCKNGKKKHIYFLKERGMRFSEMSEQKEEKKSVEEQYKEVKDLSQDELFKRLVGEVERQKQKGTFDYDGLVLTIEKMKNYLPEQTYKNILSVLEKVK